MLNALALQLRDPRQAARTALRSPTVRTFLVNALVLGLGLVSGVQLARWMGPAGRGELAAAWLWPMLLMYLASMGVIQSVVYFAALPDAQPPRVLGTALACAVVQSVVAMAVGYVVLPLLLAKQTADVVANSRAYLWVIPASLVSQYGIAVLQARLHFTAYNWIRLLVPAGYVIAVIALKQTGALDASTALRAQLWLNVAVVGATAIALWRTGAVARLADLRPDRALADRMLRYGAKVQAGGIPQTANLRMDQALLAAWFPPAQLGLYVAAVSAAGVGDVLTTAVRTVATPSIAQQGGAAGIRTLQATFRKYVAVSFVGTLALAAVLPFAIPFVYGRAFGGAVGPALVLLAAGLCLGAKTVLAGGAQALGDPWLASRSEILGAVVTVCCLPVLLPRLGIMGAALATLLAYATQLVVVLAGLSRTHAIRVPSLVWARPRRA
ncbi:MAG TPA: polysaccharide biosynthesis C-terminal domain-containing protein [Gemmatirosa sp.]